MSNNSTISKKIHDFRQKAGLTQEELAEKVGLSRGSITSIEQGKRKVTVEELLKFCEALACSHADLLFDTQTEKKQVNSNEKKNVLELYDTYKEKYEKINRKQTNQPNNPVDDYLRQVNPYYYPVSNSKIRYGQ